jgi:transposase
MARRRVKMRCIRQILQYRLEMKVSAAQTAIALKISKGTVINTTKRFSLSGISWPLPADITDSVLEARLYPSTNTALSTPLDVPTVAYIEEELAKKHVTLQCIYDEYRCRTTVPISRAAFYRYYTRNRLSEVSMAVEHRGGDLVYVDYSGDGLFYTDAKTGIRIDVELFCCCWGLSSFSFVEATETQKKRDFCQSHVRAFRYFGVSPHGLVPDNLKSAVTKADPFDPLLNPLYEELGRHYKAVILPARIRKPKDKAKVESAVLHIQQFILARLRNRQFFSLAEINQALMELLEVFNDRPMKDYGHQTRRERFERLDKPHAQPLPKEPFRITDIKYDVLVGKNYHIRYKDHFYSVPFEKTGKRVMVRRVSGVVEIFYDGQLLTRHLFSTRAFGYSTKREHMPTEHQFVKGLTPGWIIAQATKVGENTVTVIVEMLRRSEHVQQGFNAALGILHLAKSYTPERLESACRRCVHFNTITYRALKSVLENNLDQQALSIAQAVQPKPEQGIMHENLRRNFAIDQCQEEEVVL